MCRESADLRIPPGLRRVGQAQGILLWEPACASGSISDVARGHRCGLRNVRQQEPFLGVIFRVQSVQLSGRRQEAVDDPI